MPVEAHHSMGKVERYHMPLRRVYQILTEELKGQGIPKEVILQMALEVNNDVLGPNGYVPTLLVFGARSRMTNDDPPAPNVTERAEAIQKAIKEVREINAKRKVTEALATRNGPTHSQPSIFLSTAKW